MSNTTYKKDLHDIALAIANSTKTYIDAQDNNLQSQIDGINAGQNLADIVADLIDLENLDVTNLKVGDKIQVLDDDQHGNRSTVYSFNGTTRPSGTEGEDWWQGADGTYYEYIGRYGTDSYTIAETDALLGLKEDKSHKVTSLSGSSTDLQYPSAKCVYDALALKADLTNTTQVITADKVKVRDIRNINGSDNVMTQYTNNSIINIVAYGDSGANSNRVLVRESFVRLSYNNIQVAYNTVDVDGTGISLGVGLVGDRKTLQLSSSTKKLTFGGNEVIDTNNATTELFLTDAEMNTLLSEVFD